MNIQAHQLPELFEDLLGHIRDNQLIFNNTRLDAVEPRNLKLELSPYRTCVEYTTDAGVVCKIDFSTTARQVRDSKRRAERAEQRAAAQENRRRQAQRQMFRSAAEHVAAYGGKTPYQVPEQHRFGYVAPFKPAASRAVFGEVNPSAATKLWLMEITYAINPSLYNRMSLVDTFWQRHTQEAEFAAVRTMSMPDLLHDLDLRLKNRRIHTLQQAMGAYAATVMPYVIHNVLAFIEAYLDGVLPGMTFSALLRQGAEHREMRQKLWAQLLQKQPPSTITAQPHDLIDAEARLFEVIGRAFAVQELNPVVLENFRLGLRSAGHMQASDELFVSVYDHVLPDPRELDSELTQFAGVSGFFEAYHAWTEQLPQWAGEAAIARVLLFVDAFCQGALPGQEHLSHLHSDHDFTPAQFEQLQRSWLYALGLSDYSGQSPDTPSGEQPSTAAAVAPDTAAHEARVAEIERGLAQTRGSDAVRRSPFAKTVGRYDYSAYAPKVSTPAATAAVQEPQQRVPVQVCWPQSEDAQRQPNSVQVCETPAAAAVPVAQPVPDTNLPQEEAGFINALGELCFELGAKVEYAERFMRRLRQPYVRSLLEGLNYELVGVPKLRDLTLEFVQTQLERRGVQNFGSLFQQWSQQHTQQYIEQLQFNPSSYLLRFVMSASIGELPEQKDRGMALDVNAQIWEDVLQSSEEELTRMDVVMAVGQPTEEHPDAEQKLWAFLEHIFHEKMRYNDSQMPELLNRFRELPWQLPSQALALLKPCYAQEGEEHVHYPSPESINWRLSELGVSGFAEAYGTWFDPLHGVDAALLLLCFLDAFIHSDLPGQKPHDVEVSRRVIRRANEIRDAWIRVLAVKSSS